MHASTLLCVVAWVCVPTGAEGDAKFLRVGEGRCGEPFLRREHITAIHCAVICANDPRCGGFNTAAKQKEKGVCEVISRVTLPDADTNLICYVLDHPYPPTENVTTTAPTDQDSSEKEKNPGSDEKDKSEENNNDSVEDR